MNQDLIRNFCIIAHIEDMEHPDRVFHRAVQANKSLETGCLSGGTYEPRLD